MSESGGEGSASASEAAYHHVRAQILDGALLGGSMMSEGTVADELGMSRTPVREAFLRLQGEGWLRLYPKRGALVVEVRPHEREEIVRARVLIESDAVARVSGDARLRSELVERLRTSLGGQRDAAAREDLHGFATLDADFHAAIVEAGGNRLLSDFFASLSDRQRRMTARSLWKRADRLEGVLDDHTELVRLIDGAHSDAFRIALESHIRRAHRELLP
ncbi:GntR family transcriptional regulator [Microbacterium saperdae]|uniref:DNA-binding GntR family transcriptional regulator n=1 Tax=Microbacterium saperdae TaxID=69368 RepID=A0A543BLE5_9MICO|nr:GntR family transcriptional regulator [Microbacterium saperdae]TQL85641.1 DNA-binding GntR family transcriptional regulator [Microbacterium saperdae]